MLELCATGKKSVETLQKRGLVNLQDFYDSGEDLSAVSSLVYVFPEHISKSVSKHLGQPTHATAVNQISRLCKTSRFGPNFSLISSRARLLGIIDGNISHNKFAGGEHFVLYGPSTFILKTAQPSSTNTSS